MGKCPDCQSPMKVIGTEKFLSYKEEPNFTFDHPFIIYTVWYCENCNVIFLREPGRVYA